ncbi:MAG: hypothetical protein WA324_23645 [Bryobacteraceae bacterium]
MAEQNAPHDQWTALPGVYPAGNCDIGEEAGFYLLHLYSDGQGTDTWHETLEDAFHQPNSNLE